MTILLFGIDDNDLQAARDRVEHMLGIELHERDNDARGGRYFDSRDLRDPRGFREHEEFVLQRNYIASEDDWTVPEHQECALVLQVRGTRRPSFICEALAGYANLFPDAVSETRRVEGLAEEDLDISFQLPAEYKRVMKQGLVDLTPWHLLERAAAIRRMQGLRTRFRTKYIPFAYRQQNDDVACFDPDRSGAVIVVHDYASEGFELQGESHATFWDWFRRAVDELVEFSP